MTDKRKIVFILNDFYTGGAERMVYELVSRLDRENFLLRVAAVIGGGEMLGDFRKTVPVFLAGNAKNYRSFRGRLRWLISSPAIFLKTLAYLRKEKPDAVITSLYHSDLIGILAACLAGVERRVILQHDVHELSGTRRLLKKIFSVGLATDFVAISATVKDFLVEYFGAEEKKIKVIRNGVDAKRFAAAKKELDPRNIVIGSVGRLEKEKGYATFIGALDILEEKELRPETVIVGGGSEEKYLRAEAEKGGMNIGWIGAVGDPVPYLAKMDVFVVPSLEEGFGLTVAEALAAEKIVIASDLPAIRSIIKNGVNGLLFKAGDASALADKLEGILKDEGHVIDFKRKVHEWLAAHGQELDISRTVREYSEFLLEN